MSVVQDCRQIFADDILGKDQRMPFGWVDSGLEAERIEMLLEPFSAFHQIILMFGFCGYAGKSEQVE